MSKITNKQRSALKSISDSKGRFFGLYTRQGGVYNAQLVAETAKYITVYDRNMGQKVKLAKSSVDHVNIG